jgi:hypothetical protein
MSEGVGVSRIKPKAKESKLEKIRRYVREDAAKQAQDDIWGGVKGVGGHGWKYALLWFSVLDAYMHGYGSFGGWYISWRYFVLDGVDGILLLCLPCWAFPSKAAHNSDPISFF